ncbi:MAG: SMI1/KNR4 family protein [Actinomycetota bacterium]|nr:SMI1/KNR4 family protein [Actinomycetota bacterium]
MAEGARDFPVPLTELAVIRFWPDGADFESFSSFRSRSETTDWLRAWTGNAAVDGDAFRVFGQDVTGGYAAFWLVRNGEPLVAQPIVFFGSEGELGVVASNLSDFLWLLGEGSGPREVVTGEDASGPPPRGVEAIVRRHASGC